jgi:hypothetical protein
LSLQNLGRLVQTVKRLAAGGVGLGFIAVAVYAARLGDVSHFLGALAAGSLVGGACAVTGAALGFLFGLPRTTNRDSADGEASRRAVVHQVNTNLEQISDWLTKILVGLGLANLSRIPGQLAAVSRGLAGALGDTTSHAGEQFALALIVFFLGLGFLVGYLWTRLDLAPAIHWADLSTVQGGAEERNRQQIATMIADAKVAIEKGTQESVQVGLGWANLALESDPHSIPALIEKARALHRLGNTKEALSVVENVLRDEPTHFAAQYNKACYHCCLGWSIDVVLEDLKLAFIRAPFLMKHAQSDPDLSRIQQELRFRAVVDDQA